MPVETDVGLLREHDRAPGQVCEGLERLTGEEVALPKGGATGRLEASQVEEARRLVPGLRLPVVEAEARVVGFERAVVKRLDPLGDLPVEQPSPRRQQLGVCDLADPVVAEIESVPDGLNDAPAH